MSKLILKSITTFLPLFFCFSDVLSEDDGKWYGDPAKVEKGWNDLKNDYRKKKDTRIQDKEKIDRIIEQKKKKKERVVELQYDTDWDQKRKRAELEMARDLGDAYVDYGEYVLERREPLKSQRLAELQQSTLEYIGSLKEFEDLGFKTPELETLVQKLNGEINGLHKKKEKLDREIKSYEKEMDAIDDVLEAYKQEVVDLKDKVNIEKTKEVVFEFAKNVKNKKNDLIKNYGAYCVVFRHGECNKRCFWVSDYRFGEKKFCVSEGDEEKHTLTPKAEICASCETMPTEICNNI